MHKLKVGQDKSLIKGEIIERTESDFDEIDTLN